LCARRAFIGPWEGLNNKAKLTIKKACGFKTLYCLQIALYHQLGKLEDPHPPTDFSQEQKNYRDRVVNQWKNNRSITVF